MQQVLFKIPLHSLSESLPDIPIYGYGAMLFVAFLFCTWLAAWLAKKDGIAPEHVQDLAIWVFLCGILGAWITFMIQYHKEFSSFWQFFAIWDGGLVFYGSLIGGIVGFLLGYRFILRRHNISAWKMLDWIVPCLALGLCLGRVGCLLNGCCYGNVCDAEWRAVTFPLASPPRVDMTARGYQTAAGFTLDDRAKDERTVGAVEKDSPADDAGLRPGDVIVKVNGQVIDSYYNRRGNEPDPTCLAEAFTTFWPRGQNYLAITVTRGGEAVELPPITHRAIGLHPTQVYESISAALLMFLLMAYYPFRRHDGELVALFLVCYAVHRFLNEMLRDDTANVAFGMTLSQNLSIVVFTAGVVLGLWLWTRPTQDGPSTQLTQEATS